MTTIFKLIISLMNGHSDSVPLAPQS